MPLAGGCNRAAQVIAFCGIRTKSSAARFHRDKDVAEIAEEAAIANGMTK
jgi:hypothetical protein